MKTTLLFAMLLVSSIGFSAASGNNTYSTKSEPSLGQDIVTNHSKLCDKNGKQPDLTLTGDDSTTSTSTTLN